MDGSGGVTEFRAAQYVRMSTEHQQYSTNNQSDKIREYADKRGIEIVKTYADDGKSGLSIGGRAALQKLLSDVETGRADFNLILVYDISRWGRFQDADESAYYEYISDARAIRLHIAPSNSRMTARLSRPSSRASNAPWPVNTAASYRSRCSQANAA